MSNRKTQLGKRIFQFKNASDQEKKEYLDIIGIPSLSIHLLNEVIERVPDKYPKFFEHYSKFGESVTVDKFLSRPITSNSKKIHEHYQVVIEGKERQSVYDPNYIMEREGITYDEAVEYVNEYKKNKATSKENFIKKYGKEKGLEAYNEWFSSSLKRGHDSNSPKSKFSKEYYLKRGYSIEESFDLAKKYQHENSPLHIEYYIKRGKDIDYARKSIRKIHDKKIGVDGYRSKLEKDGFTYDEITSIIKDNRGHFSREKLGDDEFERRASKIRKTFEQNGVWIPLDDLSDYELYRREVWEYTNRNDLTNLENYEKRGLAGKEGAYHLDHKYSIFYGYVNGVPPEMIGSLNNLVFIPWEENVKKNKNCSVTLEELYEN